MAGRDSGNGGATLADVLRAVFPSVMVHMDSRDRYALRSVSRGVRDVIDQHTVTFNLGRSDDVQDVLARAHRWPHVRIFRGFGSAESVDIRAVACWDICEFHLEGSVLRNAPASLSAVFPWWKRIRMLKLSRAGLGPASIRVIQTAHFPCLEHLNLNGNYLGGLVNFSAEHFPALRSLDLRDVGLNDRALKYLATPATLRRLNLAHNDIQSLYSIESNMRFLDVLDVSSNMLTGLQSFLDTSSTFPNLRALDVSGNSKLDTMYIGFVYPNLTSLTLEGIAVPPLQCLRALRVTEDFDDSRAAMFAALTRAYLPDLRDVSFERCTGLNDSVVRILFGLPCGLERLHFIAPFLDERVAAFSGLSESRNLPMLHTLIFENYDVPFSTILTILKESTCLQYLCVTSVFQEYIFTAMTKTDHDTLLATCTISSSLF